MVFIYVLELNNNKYYIGKTENPKFRIDTHFNSNGSVWTKKYKPNNIHQLVPNCDNFDEDKYTLKYMKKYGIENVRGGSFCQITLTEQTKNTIKHMIKGSGDHCYNCGKSGHFASNCNKKKESDNSTSGININNIPPGWEAIYDKRSNTYYYRSGESPPFTSTWEIPTCPAPGYEIEQNKKNNSWQCEYCNKEFTTKKGCTFHENIHCKKRDEESSGEESSGEESSDEDISPDNLEKAFCEMDKDEGIYTLYGNTYLWYEDELYEESNSKTPKSLLKSFQYNCDIDYENYNWKSIHIKKYKKSTNGNCYKCGRQGHYKSYCYAKKHIDGYYL